MEALTFSLTAGYMTHKSKIFKLNIQEKENQPSINLVTLLSLCISNRLVLLREMCIEVGTHSSLSRKFCQTKERTLKTILFKAVKAPVLFVDLKRKVFSVQWLVVNKEIHNYN